MIRRCSVARNLKIVPAGRKEYDQLARFHYRDGGLGVYAGVYSFHPNVGVIVYSMPSPGAALRNVALAGALDGLDRRTRLAVVNCQIRCISRVIIDPRYRGLGLAAKLVRETLALMGKPMIEALAVMGRVNPFFEKAGMTALEGGPCRRRVQMREAFSAVGIEEHELIDAKLTHVKLQSLQGKAAVFIEGQLQRFLQSYGTYGRQLTGLERTKYILSKLGERPVYYYWFNPDKSFAAG